MANWILAGDITTKDQGKIAMFIFVHETCVLQTKFL